MIDSYERIYIFFLLRIFSFSVNIVVTSSTFSIFRLLKLIRSKSYLTFNLYIQGTCSAGYVRVHGLSGKGIIKTILINQADGGFENNAIEHAFLVPPARSIKLIRFAITE